jgi:hypothetical protein
MFSCAHPTFTAFLPHSLNAVASRRCRRHARTGQKRRRSLNTAYPYGESNADVAAVRTEHTAAAAARGGLSAPAPAPAPAGKKAISPPPSSRSPGMHRRNSLQSLDRMGFACKATAAGSSSCDKRIAATLQRRQFVNCAGLINSPGPTVNLKSLQLSLYFEPRCDRDALT